MCVCWYTGSTLFFTDDVTQMVLQYRHAVCYLTRRFFFFEAIWHNFCGKRATVENDHQHPCLLPDTTDLPDTAGLI